MSGARSAAVALILTLGVALPGASVAQTDAPATPSPKPSPQSVTGIVSDLIAAGRNAASNVYIVHQYGANLGLTPADVARFDIQYIKLASDANGLLEVMAFSVQSNTVDSAKIQAAAASVSQEAQNVDAAVTQLQSKQQATSTSTQFGLNLGDLLKVVVPMLNPVIGSVIDVLDASSKAKVSAQADRTALANQIRQEYWPDIKTAVAGTWQPPSPTPIESPAVAKPSPAATR